MTEVIFSMLLGSVAGLLAGLFGLGGGVVIVPALYWLFSMQQFPANLLMLMAIATSLATIIFTSISSTLAHQELGTVLWDRVFRLSPGILVGAGVGAVMASYIAVEILRWFFIIYLFYTAIRMAFQTGSTLQGQSEKTWLDYPAGLGIGLLSSILGIGGGSLSVPYLVARQLVMKNAVAVSSACGLSIAVSGTITYMIVGWNDSSLPVWSLGYIYLPAFSGIAICSIVTAPLGAKLANKLPARKLKHSFSIVIFLIAIKMIFS